MAASSGRQLLQTPTATDCDRSVKHCDTCRYQFYRGTVTKVRRTPRGRGLTLPPSHQEAAWLPLADSAPCCSSARTITHLSRLPSLPGLPLSLYPISTHPLPLPPPNPIFDPRPSAPSVRRATP